MASEEERELVIARMQTIPPSIRFSTLSGKSFSRDEAIQAIREESPEGDLIVDQQLTYLRGLRQ